MRSMSQIYTIKEYDSFTRNVNGLSNRYHALPESLFDRLEQFILSRKDDDTEALELMTISSRRGIGKVISAKNYVGIITMNDGTQIEILPKLYSQNEESSEEETKRVFLDMLKFLKEMPFKTFNMSNLQVDKNSILEIFIKMFIKEVYQLVKQGLKSTYITHQDNEFFYKGKLKVAEHIKSNYVHKERFFIEYDVFSVNRPENQVIKTTLMHLKKITSSRKNKMDLRRLLLSFEMVDESPEPLKELERIYIDRSIKEYETILQWCRIFLNNQSFTPFKGKDVAYALLFPMERVFESYVAGQLKNSMDNKRYQVKTQDQSYYLFDEPKRFLLKPDIVVAGENTSIVLDTKWKVLTPNKRDFGVSQADMYQMYAYQKKYAAKMVFLLYPWVNTLQHIITEPVIYRSNDNVTVCIAFIDLVNITSSMEDLSDKMNEYMG